MILLNFTQNMNLFSIMMIKWNSNNYFNRDISNLIKINFEMKIFISIKLLFIEIFFNNKYQIKKNRNNYK